MKRQDFFYELPESLIAKYPPQNRTESRLMIVGEPNEHRSFADIVDYLAPNDLLVFNDTKVIPARLFAAKSSGGKVEILIERITQSHRVLAHVKASKSPKAGTVLILEDGLSIDVVGREGALFELDFSASVEPVLEVLDRLGHIPLPPYINRDDEQTDIKRYQTVYSKKPGAVAAPTAGLHFDETLLETLKSKGIRFAFVTLHVGAGTFQPVRVDDIKTHQMHSEYAQISEDTCQLIQNTKKAGGKVIAVGTTSVRTLESAASSGELKPFDGETDIFIYPGFNFKVVDEMITNFHLPESTLLMLISAFSGQQTIFSAYREAIDLKYRFFSYGDAMLLRKPLKKQNIKRLN